MPKAERPAWVAFAQVSPRHGQGELRSKRGCPGVRRVDTALKNWP